MEMFEKVQMLKKETGVTYEEARKVLEEAYERLRLSGDTDITDDTMIVERYMDIHSKMIEGSYENIKVTTPEDIRLAEIFLS